ncbi:MAG: TrkA C-terminal domain-containing protein [Bacillota bacterium]|jgi:K+/H+ antiporter YhaU regulatory subunit KhtT
MQKREKKRKIAVPKYQQIAADLAAKIADKRYQVGDKIYARSSLASLYGVSAETARRAICVLSDMKVVDTTKGSGVVISSYENAVKFLNHHQDIKTMNNLKSEILGIIEEQTHNNQVLNELVSEMMEKTDRFKNINPFIPFEVTIDESSPYIGKNISEINFWHNTSATIIAILHEERLLLSPGPYAILEKGDTIYFVGDENSYAKVKNFLCIGP